MNINKFISTVGSATERGSSLLYFKIDPKTQKTIDVFAGHRNFFYQQYMRLCGYSRCSDPRSVVLQLCSTSKSLGVSPEDWNPLLQRVCMRLNANGGCQDLLTQIDCQKAETRQKEPYPVSFTGLVEQTFKKEKDGLNALKVLENNPSFPKNGYNIVLSYLTEGLCEACKDEDPLMKRVLSPKLFNRILSPELFCAIVDGALEKTGALPDKKIILTLGQVAVTWNQSRLLKAILLIRESLFDKLFDYSIDNQCYDGLISLLEAYKLPCKEVLELAHIACDDRQDIRLFNTILAVAFSHPDWNPLEYEMDLLELAAHLLSIEEKDRNDNFQQTALYVLFRDKRGAGIFLNDKSEMLSNLEEIAEANNSQNVLKTLKDSLKKSNVDWATLRAQWAI